MALTPPNKKWNKPLGKDERIWALLIVLSIVMMSALTLGWVVGGKQNPPEKFDKMTPAEYRTRMRNGNTAANEVSLTTIVVGANTYNAVSRTTEGDIYMMAGAGGSGGATRLGVWEWRVESGDNASWTGRGLKLKQNVKYTLHLSSFDILHGFEILDLQIMIQVVPGYDYRVDFIPTTLGVHGIICNEFCGSGHHQMVGFIEVVA